MSGTSILRSDYFFLFFSPSPLSPFPPALRFFFPDSFQLICVRFIYFSGIFSIIIFYGISFELGPFFMGYVSPLLTTKES